MGKVGGKRPGAGRKKGSKSRTTIERERAAQLERDRVAEAEKVLAGKSSELEKAVGSQRKLMKEIGFELTMLAAGLAAFYQPNPTGQRDANNRPVHRNPNYDEQSFRYYLQIGLQGAKEFGAFESPKLSAVMVGQQIVNNVVVEGGMPSEFEPPVAGEVEFKPGDIISAEDGVADSKVINGEIVPLKAAG